MLKTTNDKIRNVCKSICKIFMKTKQFDNLEKSEKVKNKKKVKIDEDLVKK